MYDVININRGKSGANLVYVYIIKMLSFNI